MGRLFISYGRSDEDFARRVAKELSNDGYDVWLDVEDVPQGMNWSNAIEQGLDAADVLLLVITPQTIGSLSVEREWRYAYDNNKPIITLFRRSTPLPDELQRQRTFDFANRSFGSAYGDLVSTINNMLYPKPKRKDRLHDPIDTAHTTTGVSQVIWVAVTVLILLSLGAASAIFYLVETDSESGGSGSVAVGVLRGTSPPYAREIRLPDVETLRVYSTLGNRETTREIVGAEPNYSLNFFLEHQGALWITIEFETASMSGDGYVLPTDLTADEDLIYALRLSDIYQNDAGLTFYNDPNGDGNTFTLTDRTHVVSIFGFWADNRGQYSVYAEKTGSDARSGWIQLRNEEAMLVDLLPAYTLLTDSVTTDEDITLAAGTAVRLVRVVDGAYRSVVYHAGAWQIVHIPIDALDVPDAVAAIIAGR